MNKLLTHTCLLLFSTALFAQTSNDGMLYISGDTQFSTVEELDNLDSGEVYNDGEVRPWDGKLITNPMIRQRMKN